MSLINLFLIYVKIGAVLLGGGYVILPMLESEFVYKRNLITQDELTNYFALSQSLPGIIAANISMFIGYKLRGKLGALIAMLGIIFVPFWSIVLLASCLSVIVNNIYVQGIFWGVSIAVISLILLTIREVWRKSDRDMFFYVIFFTSLFAILFFKLSPIQTIIIFSSFGVLLKYLIRRISIK